MKLEDQVCTLEQAKKLRLLDLKAKSEFNWVLHSAREKWQVTRKYSPNDFSFLPPLDAYTVAELGVLLEATHFYVFYINGSATIENKANHFLSVHKINDLLTEARARANALIWLIENEYVKVEDLKL